MFAVKSDWHKSVQLFVGSFDRLDARPIDPVRFQANSVYRQINVDNFLLHL